MSPARAVRGGIGLDLGRMQNESLGLVRRARPVGSMNIVFAKRAW